MNKQSTILIVDDEPVGRRTLRALLMAHGYNLAFASTGPEALAMAAKVAPDLILLDVMMPGMDGFEVCRRLRADPLLAEVPVVLVTALDDRRSRVEGIESGADDFVSKPFDPIELRARVQTITQLNRYRRLHMERARFEWVVQQADDGYPVLNDGGDVLYANPQARLYLSLPAAEDIPVPETFLQLADEQYRREPLEAWASWPAPAPSPRYLVRPEAPASDAFWLQVDLVDLSPQSQADRLIRLRDVTADVHARSSEWTFQALVSHKLRTPLYGMIMAFQLIDWEALPIDKEQADLLQAARESTSRLHSEIENVLRYVKGSDAAKSVPGRCSLADIPEIVTGVSTSLSLAGPKVSLHAPEPDKVFVQLSRQTLEMILWEILENSIKFHPTGSPQVDVDVSGVSTAVHIRVADDGLTLSPGQLARMWVPYYQAEKRFTGQVPGMGLGLSMVATLVWKVGGTCRAYNREDGPGVVVELELPYGKGERVPR